MTMAVYVPPHEQSITDLAWMREALVMAEEALSNDEVPVGCVFVKDGQAIARARNRTNEWRNATLHAELEAIDHLLPLHPPPLSSITLYVTVEPCVMCASALRQIGIGRVIYGCGNDRFGGCGSVIDVNSSERLNTHAPFVAEGGYYREEAIMLLRRFYLSENQNAPNPKKKSTRVLKTDIPPPSYSNTPYISRPTSVGTSSSVTTPAEPNVIPDTVKPEEEAGGEEGQSEQDAELIRKAQNGEDREKTEASVLREQEKARAEFVGKLGSTTIGRQGLPIGSTLVSTPREATPVSVTPTGPTTSI